MAKGIPGNFPPGSGSNKPNTSRKALEGESIVLPIKGGGADGKKFTKPTQRVIENNSKKGAYVMRTGFPPKPKESATSEELAELKKKWAKDEKAEKSMKRGSMGPEMDARLENALADAVSGKKKKGENAEPLVFENTFDAPVETPAVSSNHKLLRDLESVLVQSVKKPMTPEQRAGFKAEMRKLVGKIDPAIVNGTATKEDDARKLAEVNARLQTHGTSATPAENASQSTKPTHEERGRIVSTLNQEDLDKARTHFQNGGTMSVTGFGREAASNNFTKSPTPEGAIGASINYTKGEFPSVNPLTLEKDKKAPKAGARIEGVITPIDYTKGEFPNAKPLTFEKEQKAQASGETDVAANSQRLVEMAKATRGPELAAKLATELAGGPRTTKEVAEKHAKLAEGMLSAEQVFFEGLKIHHKKRGTMHLIADNLLDIQDKLPKELQAKRDEWMTQRGLYYGGMQTSLSSRYAKREKGLIDRKLSKRHTLEQVAARHERRFGVAKAALTGAEEAMLTAKTEGMNSREKNALDKMFDSYKKMPAHKRILATSAVLTAIGAGITLAGGGILMLVPLAIAGGSMAASAFLARKAENAKTARGKKVYGTLAGLTSVAGWAGFLGNAVTRGAHSIFGTKQKAKDTIERQKGMGLLDVKHPSDFADVSREFQKAAGAEKRVERDARRVQILSSLAGGAAFGTWLSHNVPHVAASTDDQGHLRVETTPPGAVHGGHPAITGPGGHNTAPGVVPVTPHAPTAPHVEHRPVEAHIDHRGEGADKLYEDLVRRLHTEYPDPATAPPLVRHLFEFRNADQFSQVTGFENLPESAVMRMAGGHFSADTFSVSADGHRLTYIDNTGHEHVLASTNAAGEVEMSRADGLMMRDYTHHEAPQPLGSTATTPEVPTSPATSGEGVAEAAALNRAEALQNGHLVDVGVSPASADRAGSSALAPEQPTPPAEQAAPVPAVAEHPATSTSGASAESPAAPARAPGESAALAQAQRSTELPRDLVAAPPAPVAPGAEAAPQMATNHNGLIIDYRQANGYEGVTNGHSNLYVVGGSDAERQTQAIALARLNPGKPVYFEGRPMDFGRGPQHWTSFVTSDRAGHEIHRDFPTNSAAIGVKPNVESFTRVIPLPASTSR